MKNTFSFVGVVSFIILIALGIQAFLWACVGATAFKFETYSFMGWIAQIAFWALCLTIAVFWWDEDFRSF